MGLPWVLSLLDLVVTLEMVLVVQLGRACGEAQLVGKVSYIQFGNPQLCGFPFGLLHGLVLPSFHKS